MKWDRNTRQVYVRAYIQGMMDGFNGDCDGRVAAQPKAPDKSVLGYMSTCLSRSPLSQRDSMKMVDMITEFYTRYPLKRDLDISEFLLNFHAGLSPDQTNGDGSSLQNEMSVDRHRRVNPQVPASASRASTARLQNYEFLRIDLIEVGDFNHISMIVPSTSMCSRLG